MIKAIIKKYSDKDKYTVIEVRNGKCNYKRTKYGSFAWGSGHGTAASLKELYKLGFWPYKIKDNTTGSVLTENYTK